QDLGLVLDDIQDNKSAAWFNGNRAIVLAIQRQPGTNTVAVAGRVRDVMQTLRQQLPGSVDLQLRSDRSVSILASLHDVQFTLFLTLALVVLVIFLFLRNFSATVAASLVSGVVSLTLTPMLCSRFLKPSREAHHGRFYEASERVYERVLHWYEGTLEWVMARRPAALVFSVAILVSTAVLFWAIPK